MTRINGFSSNNEAFEALNQITDVVGISPNFRLIPCNGVTTNASAFTFNGNRYIFYNSFWMKNLSYDNDWAGISVLAHEVGHHVQGHTKDLFLYLSGSAAGRSLAERRTLELEADEFSGFVLAKLGASLNEATYAIRVGLPWTEVDTYSTHPASRKRLAAIKKGYKKAGVGFGFFNTLLYYPNYILNSYQDAAQEIHSIIPIPVGFITYLLCMATIFLFIAVFREIFEGTEFLEKIDKWNNSEIIPSKDKKNKRKNNSDLSSSDDLSALVDKFLDNTIGKLISFFDEGNFLERKNKSELERAKKISTKTKKRFKVGYVAKEVYKVGKFGNNTYKLINSKGVKVGAHGTSRGLRVSAYNKGMAVQAYIDKNGRKYYRKVNFTVYKNSAK